MMETKRRGKSSAMPDDQEISVFEDRLQASTSRSSFFKEEDGKREKEKRGKNERGSQASEQASELAGRQASREAGSRGTTTFAQRRRRRRRRRRRQRGSGCWRNLFDALLGRDGVIFKVHGEEEMHRPSDQLGVNGGGR
ncbi:hypothetical protein HZH66_003935 [Vespula vulgaris]|uniref:Uncharacterized protein n=1 Tax=Vespula vulgaris TaxID=7454 RepID=A0A834KHT2_VESVU|nr:hypothetical protein HZH66_003935 [Vespula vulgaris]